MRVCARLTSSQLSSTLTSFDRRMRVERTLMQTLASQLSSTLILVESLNSYFESLNSYFQSLNSYFQSLNSYLETVADTREGGGGGTHVEQGNTPIYKYIKLLSHYSNISNNEFDIPSIIFERFAYLKPTPKAYMLKISPPPPPPPPIFRQVSATASFDRRMRVERTLVQTLASQLSSTLILV